MMRYCDSCEKYTFKEKCPSCGKDTKEKSYKFKLSWFSEKKNSKKRFS